jgi:hypothetical protein
MFKTPEMEVVKFAIADVITTSVIEEEELPTMLGDCI